MLLPLPLLFLPVTSHHHCLIHQTALLTKQTNNRSFQIYHEGEVQGEPEDEERPLLLRESLHEVAKDLASLRETEQASEGSFFIGVRGGVQGGEWVTQGVIIASSSSEEPLPSKREGEVSGVSNGVFAAPLPWLSWFS